jgi:dihydrofolate synthase/folylpolyglutamate synthase
MMTVLAFLAFEEAGCAVSIIETGLGGRLDSTNTVAPRVCILTSISLDHRYILGDTPAAIAAEKAGIIKRGVPVVCAAPTPDVEKVICGAAQAAGAPLLRFGNECSMSPEADGTLTWHCAGRTIAGIHLAAPGRFQHENFSLALCAFSQLHAPDDTAVRRAAAVTIPGRLQCLGDTPPLYFDPGHNAAAFEAVAGALAEKGLQPQLLLLTLMADKEPLRLLPLLRRLYPRAGCRLVYVTDPSPRAWTPRPGECAEIDLIGQPDPVALAGLIAASGAACVLACGSSRTHGLWLDTARILRTAGGNTV